METIDIFMIPWYNEVTMQGKITVRRGKTSGKTIKVRAVTAERLDKLRHKGQSYDGIVWELIDYFEKKGEESK